MNVVHRRLSPATHNQITRKEDFMKRLLILAALITLIGSAWAQNATTVVKADEMAWKDHPVFPGAHIAILVGDPTKAEVVVQRVKFPPNYRVAPHTHPYAEVVTVISGTIGAGMGEKFEAKGEMLKPGSLFALPAKHAHYVWTTNDESILQVQFTGPGGIDFINPADDPRKK
jgi:quercetin dioxygenase-like cupin family protein